MFISYRGIELYMAKPWQEDNLRGMINLWSELDINIYVPNPVSPWHVATRFKQEGMEPVVVNFWPHLFKTQRDGERAVEGKSESRRVLMQAHADSYKDILNDLIDDEDNF